MPSGRIALFQSILAVSLLLGAVSLACATQEPVGETAAYEPSPREDTAVLETVIVSGVVPGPSLWKVYHGDHTMWILGTLQPVAKRMQWETSKVERTVASAEIILYPPRLTFDLGMGRLRSLMLMPSLMAARKNPDKDKLVDHVSSEDYARWLVLKKKYLGHDRGVEKRRPLFAAEALYRKALAASDLEIKGLASPIIDKIAKRQKIPVERPKIELVIDDAKGTIGRFREGAIDDGECFHKTLDHLESDLEKMRIRANAWATGDMLTLREMSYEDKSRACMDAFLESGFAKDQGIDDLPARMRALWLDAAEKILIQHKNSFAVLPLDQLVTADGYLAHLAARGYHVDAP